jgi:hypothetical protein
MKKCTKGLVITLMNFVIIATIGSIYHVANQEDWEASAQQFPIATPSNSTASPSPLSNQSMTNQTGESLVGSFGSPQALMEAVITQMRNTNATDFAIRQFIDNTTSNILNETSNMTGTSGPSNMTQDATNDTAINTVIEKTQNTNATGFAANNVINLTKSQPFSPQK